MKAAVSIEQFCRVAGIGRNSGYNAARQNTLPVRTIRVGKRILIPRCAVEELFGVEAVQAALPELRAATGGDPRPEA